MNTFIKEMFLNTYFNLEAYNSNLIDVKTIFDICAKIYFVNKKEGNELYELVNKQEIKEIVTLDDYNRVSRINKYLEITGVNYDKELDEIINIKGRALENASAQKLKVGSASSKVFLFNQIYSTASKGVIYAKNVLGILQHEGIHCQKSVKKALKNFKEGCMWNNVTSTLLLLFYSNSKKEAINVLYTLTHNKPYEELCHRAESKYKVKHDKLSEENKMVDKVIAINNLNPLEFHPQYSKLIYSECLSLKDKNKILTSLNKDLFAASASLPLNLKKRDYETNLDAVKSNEMKELFSNLINHKINSPWFIKIDSNYDLTVFHKLIGQVFCNSNVKFIDISSFSGEELLNIASNYFINVCDDKKHNIYILDIQGDIDKNILKKLNLHLKNKFRFILNQMGIELDLSLIDVICLVSKENVNKINDCCQEIELKLDKNAFLIDYMLEEKKQNYQLTNLEIDEEAKNILLTMNLDNVDEVLKKYILENKVNDSILISANKLNDIIKKSKSLDVVYGFKGAKYEKN